MTTIKDKLVLSIGLDVIERPRALQQSAQTDEHNIVHGLYSLQRDGLTEFKRRRGKDSPGTNLSKIRLTPRGVKRYEELTR